MLLSTLELYTSLKNLYFVKPIAVVHKMSALSSLCYRSIRGKIQTAKIHYAEQTLAPISCGGCSFVYGRSTWTSFIGNEGSYSQLFQVVIGKPQKMGLLLACREMTWMTEWLCCEFTFCQQVIHVHHCHFEACRIFSWRWERLESFIPSCWLKRFFSGLV